MLHFYKWALCLAVLGLSLTQAQAQQEPLFAQYNSNAFVVNPAIAGSTGGHNLRLFHRWQWVSFPGAPKTFGLTYQGLFKDMHGVGALLFGDQTGPLTRWGAKLSYAFHLPLAGGKMRLAIGLGGRFVRNVIRTNAITFIESNDQAVADLAGGVNLLDAEAGIFLHSDKFYVGVAAPNLFQSKLDYGINSNLRTPLGYGYVHYFLSAGYRHTLGNTAGQVDSTGKKVGTSRAVTLEPSIMVKYVRGAQVQVDGGILAHFLENQLSFGIFYRTPHFLSFQCRFVFDKQIPVVLSFDVATSRFQQYSVGATEVMMGYDFPTRGNMYAPPAPKEEED